MSPADLELRDALCKAFSKLLAAESGATVDAKNVVGLYSRDKIEQDGAVYVLELWDVLPAGRTGKRSYRLGELPQQIIYAD